MRPWKHLLWLALLALLIAAPAWAQGAVAPAAPEIPEEVKQGLLAALLSAVGPWAVGIVLALPVLNWGATEAHKSGIPVLSQLGWLVRWILPVGNDGKVGTMFVPPTDQKKSPGGLRMLGLAAVIGAGALLAGCGTRYAPCLKVHKSWEHAQHCLESMAPLIDRACDALPEAAESDAEGPVQGPDEAPDSEPGDSESDSSGGQSLALRQGSRQACSDPGG